MRKLQSILIIIVISIAFLCGNINLNLVFSGTLDDIEKAVVEVLIEHYNKTGSKFIMVKDQYELAEKLQVNPSELPNALKNLRQDGIIYIFRDKTFNQWKIGIKKDFLKLLERGSWNA